MRKWIDRFGLYNLGFRGRFAVAGTGMILVSSAIACVILGVPNMLIFGKAVLIIIGMMVAGLLFVGGIALLLSAIKGEEP